MGGDNGLKTRPTAAAVGPDRRCRYAGQMQYRTFGATGWKVSEIGFGGWALGGGAWGHQDDGESLKALRRSLDLGINLIDTAAGYGNGRSERVIAEALADHKDKVYLV